MKGAGSHPSSGESTDETIPGSYRNFKVLRVVEKLHIGGSDRTKSLRDKEGVARVWITIAG